MDSPITNIHGLSRRFGIPAGWFKAEAKAGRLPHLRVGQKFIFNVKAVEQALSERAAGDRPRVDANLEACAI